MTKSNFQSAMLLVCGAVLLLTLVTTQADMIDTLYDVDDYQHHPCNRPCEEMSPPRLCQYKWVVESYWTLPKACLNCPFNQSDCFRPHCISTDGVQRGIITVNRMLPGPAVEVCEGDTVEVTVHNELVNSEGTSVHWHGLLQRGTPHMDGVSLVTQCPITARSSFVYRFRAEDPGTHYWHAHAGLHKGDGMFGAIVVRQPPSLDPHYALYDHDLSEHVIIVHDWMDMMSLPKYLGHHHDGRLTTPSMMLINGRGAHEEFKDGNSTYYTPRASFTVEGGKKYRFRIISNAIAVCPIQISVDNHTMIVIASDGSPFEPFTTDSFDILGGERYDFILYADKTANLSNYWIRARGMVLCGFGKAHQLARLHYAGASDEDPTGPTDWDSSIREGMRLNPYSGAVSNLEMDITRMRSEIPDENDGVLTSVPDKKFYLGMDFYWVDSFRFNNPNFYPLSSVDASMRTYPTQINRISSRLPPSPPLSQYDDIPASSYCNEFTVQKNCDQEWCSCVHKIDVSLGDLVELIVVDESAFRDANHPVHIHGFKFRAVAMGKLNSSTTVQEVKALDERGGITRSTSRAPHKDTITVPNGGYVVLRFRADNPGMWLFHCHTDSHVANGMGVIIQVGTKSEFPKTPKNFPTCGSWAGPPDDDENDDEEDVKVKQPIYVECRNTHNSALSQTSVLSSVLVGLMAFVNVIFWRTSASVQN